MEMNAEIHTQSSSPTLALKYCSYVILFFLKILELLNPKFHHRNHHGLCAGRQYFFSWYLQNVLHHCSTGIHQRK
jgi:hypothetical protein